MSLHVVVMCDIVDACDIKAIGEITYVHDWNVLYVQFCAFVQTSND